MLAGRKLGILTNGYPQDSLFKVEKAPGLDIFLALFPCLHYLQSFHRVEFHIRKSGIKSQNLHFEENLRIHLPAYSYFKQIWNFRIAPPAL